MSYSLEENPSLMRRAPSWTVPLLIALASIVILGTVYVAQYGYGLQPCELCLWQRYPYMVTIALGGVGILVSRSPLLRCLCVALAAFAFLAGVGISGFHVGVEYGWWDGLSGCSAPAIEKGMSLDELKQALAARSEVVPCDEPAWSLFGISMAGYNALVSLALFQFSLRALYKRWV